MTDRKQTMLAFLHAMTDKLPTGSRVMACQFAGDPNADFKGKWVARPLVDLRQLDDDANVYLCVSAMGQNERGEFRRRKENFKAGLLLMIDDVGDGPGSKFPLTMVAAAPPTALIETSPGNHQAVYIFRDPVEDPGLFNALINGFIARQFLGKDTGMAGINRVFRPPYGVNGKPKYGGWKVRCAEWRPEALYSIHELAAAYHIDLDAFTVGPRIPKATIGKAEAIRAFVAVRQALRGAGMLKKEEADLAGWQDVTCPWTGDHTGGVDNGAAIREPAPENDYQGAFRCHHGGCEGRGWKELTDWLAENQERVIDGINEDPGEAERWIGHDR